MAWRGDILAPEEGESPPGVLGDSPSRGEVHPAPDKEGSDDKELLRLVEDDAFNSILF